jgi:hypothetical protein
MTNRLAEYEFFGTRVQQMSERRQMASRTYLTVNTAVFTVIAFLVKDSGFRGWGLVMASAPLFLMGAVACVVWSRIITDLRDIIGWHYEKLRAMENAIPECSRIYSLEWEAFFRPREGKDRYNFSQLELWLPRLFLGLYAVYGVGLSIATALGWR